MNMEKESTKEKKKKKEKKTLRVRFELKINDNLMYVLITGILAVLVGAIVGAAVFPY